MKMEHLDSSQSHGFGSYDKRVDSHAHFIYKSISDEKNENKSGKRSSHMCMMIMKKAISEAFRDTMFEKR